MPGTSDAGPTGGSPASRPPDWPEPGTPLPGEEPTIELPVVTEAMLAAASAEAPSPPAPVSPGSGPPDAPGSPPPTGPGSEPSTRPLAHPGPGSEPTGSGQARAGRIRCIPPLPGRAHRPVPPPTGPARPVPPLTGPAGAADPPGVTDRVRADGPRGATGSDTARPHPAAEFVDARPAEPGRRWMVGAGIAAAALLLTGATVVALTRGGRPADPGWSPPVAAAAAGRPHTVGGALDGRTAAGFDLVDGAQRVTVRAADLGDRRYRITTPAGGGAGPHADEQDGRVRLRLDGNARAVDVVLNAAVRWDLRFAGGAGSSSIDLSGGRVAVDATAGMSALTVAPS